MKWYKIVFTDMHTRFCKIDIIQSDDDLTKHNKKYVYAGDEECEGFLSVEEINLKHIKEKLFELIQNASEETIIRAVLSDNVIDNLCENDFVKRYGLGE